MTLIGLGGAKRAGKSAVADVLRKRFGFTILDMSAPLHEALLTLDPWVRATPGGALPRLPDGSVLVDLCNYPMRYSRLAALVDYDEMKSIPEVRRLLQVFGTEVGRGLFGEDVWVRKMEERIEAIRAPFRYPHGDGAVDEARIAVTGIRFENELEMIQDLGGTSIYVRRAELLTNTDTHASERSLISTDFDHVLVNGGTLPELEARVIEHTFEHHGISPTTSTTQS